MEYKVIRDLSGNLICYGENNGMYNPVIKTGQVQTIEDTFPLKSETQINNETKEKRLEEIDARFEEIDNESTRSLRELRFTPDDVYAVDKLAAFEIELAALRAERLTLI